MVDGVLDETSSECCITAITTGSGPHLIYTAERTVSIGDANGDALGDFIMYTADAPDGFTHGSALQAEVFSGADFRA